MSAFDQFQGTRPLGSQPSFDQTALLGWMQQHVPDFCGPMQVEQFNGGQSNPTYKISTPKRSYVLRAKPGPSARLLPSAHAIEREYAIMRALSNSAVPVPTMLGLCDDEACIGRAFYVMEFKPGRVLWDQSLPDLSPARRARIYDEMNRVISALHGVNFQALGLADFGRPGNYFERQIARWSKQYQASVTTAIAEMDLLMAWLPTHIPAMAHNDALVSIVHGDFRLDNLIFAPDEDRIVAVLDWELSTLGHPFADFSYHCMTWHIPPGAFRGISGLDLDTLGIPQERAYVRRYCERTGFADADALMADWNFYMAYNLFRIAAILQGIAKRVQAGTASSAQAKASAAGAKPLAQLAWKFAQSA